jgi:hypothetical protein
MNTTTELSGIAADLLNAADLDWPLEPEAILRPAWKKVRRTNDWRNYIPDAMRERWLRLSDDARVAAYILAEQIAEIEDWD